MTLGVPAETQPGERRVAMTPDAAGRLAKKSGYDVLVQRGAGEAAGFVDAAYEAAGARLVSREEAFGAEVVCCVQAPDDRDGLKEGTVLVGFLSPLDAPETAADLARRGVTALAMELVPRTTRAQRMDALSAMSTVAGYKAALLAASYLPKFFPLLTTAAGTLRPARLLVLGAGVAGLQALATARRLGAITSGYDIRAAAAEQVQSVGAKFVTLDVAAADADDGRGYAKALQEDEQRRQTDALMAVVAEHDAVITTALIPGRRAPELITQAGVEAMRPGSVIVDLAAPNGGNCAVTQPGETVRHGGVTVLGPTNLAADMPLHASEMYAKTVSALVAEFTDDAGAFAPNPNDEIFAGCCVTRGGAVVNERVKSLVEALS